MTQKSHVFILPGFSLKNRDWADGIAKTLSPKFTTKVCYWPHWTGETTTPDWLDKESEKLQGQIGSQPANLIAKSIGSYIAVKFLEVNPNICDRLLICGLPINDLSAEDKNHYSVLNSLPAERVLVIQNESDNHGSFTQVKEFVHNINPRIEILSRSRADHEYPYPEDFIRFLAKQF